jgi:hypothetical protein
VAATWSLSVVAKWAMSYCFEGEGIVPQSRGNVCPDMAPFASEGMVSGRLANAAQLSVSTAS